MPINIQQALNYRFNQNAIDQAHQMGWSDDQINAYKQQIFNDLTKQNAVEAATQAQQQQQQAQQDHGNWLTHLLPSAGGIGGSLGGAAAGAALGSVVPIVGTGVGALVGGILGGAGGSALGKVGENAAEGNSDLGQGVGQEALMGGITGVPLGSALKLGQAGFKLATGIGKSSIGDLLAQAGEKAIPSAMAKGAAQTTGDAIANSAASSAGVDGLGNALQPSLLQRAGSALQNVADGQLAKNQVNLTRANIRQIGGFDPADLMAQMRQNYGLTNMEDINRLGSFATGRAGQDNGGAILTNMIENAAASGKGIDPSGLEDIIKPVMGQLDSKDATKLTNALNQAKATMGNASNGVGAATNPNLADPLGALRSARDLANQAFQIKNAPSATVSELKRADAMNNLAQEIKNRVYNGQQSLDTAAGGAMSQDAQKAVSDGVAQLRGEAQKYAAAGNTKFANALNSLADQAEAAPNLKGLDALQSPFVKASQMSDMTNLAQGGGALPDVGIKNTFTGMVNGLAGEAVKPGLNTILGKLAGVGDTMAGAGANAAASSAGGQTLRGAVARNVAERGVAGAVGSANDAANNVDLPPELAAAQGAGAGGLGQPDMSALAGGNGGGTSDPMAGFGVTPDQVKQAMVQAVQSGNTKAVSDLSTLYSAMQKTQSQAQASTKLSAQQQKDIQSGKDAMSYLTSMEQNLANAGGAQGPAGSTADIPGIGQFLNPKGAAFQATRVDVATALAKAMTGGKPSSQQIDQWMHSLPSVTDTPAAVQYKLQNIRNALNNKMQETMAAPQGSSTDLASLLSGMSSN